LLGDGESSKADRLSDPRLSLPNAPLPKGTDPIATILEENGFDQLLAAMVYVDDELGAGLVDLFQDGNKPHTLFAPTNSAFEDLFALISSLVGLPVEEINDIDPNTVLNVLLANVAPGNRSSSSVLPKKNLKRINTLLGEPFYVRGDGSIQDGLTGTGLRPYNPVVVDADLVATNGIIHVIDQVVFPPSVVALLTDDQPDEALMAIIAGFCAEALRITEEVFRELDQADLGECPIELERCLSGTIGDNPVECLNEFSRCLENGREEVNRACDEALDDYEEAYRDALGAAENVGLEDEFLDWFYSPASQECLQPIFEIASACAGE
jgi:uncharacterized surface protein with fasciclin (FAS1) repeats